MGIQISQIRCAEDVKKVIKYAKFYPEGERGVCRFVRAADYSSLNRNAFFKKENEKIIVNHNNNSNDYVRNGNTCICRPTVLSLL